MVTGAGVSSVRQHDQPGGREFAQEPWIRAAVRSCMAPGRGPETYRISPSGVEMTCRFMPWRRCLPE